MLVLLIEDSWFTDTAIASALNIKKALATFHLTELDKVGLVESAPPGIHANETTRRMAQNGRSYLFAHNLLS